MTTDPAIICVSDELSCGPSCVCGWHDLLVSCPLTYWRHWSFISMWHYTLPPLYHHYITLCAYHQTPQLSLAWWTDFRFVIQFLWWWWMGPTLVFLMTLLKDGLVLCRLWLHHLCQYVSIIVCNCFLVHHQVTQRKHSSNSALISLAECKGTSQCHFLRVLICWRSFLRSHTSS